MRTGLVFYLLLGWLGGLATYTMSAYGNDLTTWGYVALVYFVGLQVLLVIGIVPRKGKGTLLQLDRIPASQNLVVILRNKPWWAIAVVAVGFVLIPVTVSIFHAYPGGIPQIENGQYVLMNHGVLVKVLTAEEYHRRIAVSVMFFSQFWIVLMGFAIAVVAADRPSTRRSTLPA